MSSPQPGKSANRAHSRSRSAPVAARARTARGPSASPTVVSGWAWSGETEHPELAAGLRSREADPPPAEPVQATVEHPEDANDEPRRGPRAPLSDCGHAAPAFDGTPIDERVTVADS